MFLFLFLTLIFLLTVYTLRFYYSASGGTFLVTLRLLHLQADLTYFLLSHIPFYLRATRYYKSLKHNSSYNISYHPDRKGTGLDWYKIEDGDDNNDDEKRMIIVFVYGGAWMSGSRTLYAILADRLRQRYKAHVVVPDYVYYPLENNVLTMVDDIRHVVLWCAKNINKNQTKNNIWIVGHSAGAHLAMMTVLEDVIRGSGNPYPESWSTSLGPCNDKVSFFPATKRSARSSAPSSSIPLALPHIRGIVCMSGCYDLVEHAGWERARGVFHVSAMQPVTRGQWERCSPRMLAREVLPISLKQHGNNTKYFPKICVFHSGNDLTVSEIQSLWMYEELKRAGWGNDGRDDDVFLQYHRVPEMDHVEVVLGLMEGTPNKPGTHAMWSILEPMIHGKR